MVKKDKKDKKKRGRKPSGKIIDYKNIIESDEKKSDEECIIAHIPINFSEIDNDETKDTTVTETNSITDIFLKQDSIINVSSLRSLKLCIVAQHQNTRSN